MANSVQKVNTLEANVTELNSLIQQGKILEAFEKFYAPEVIMQENENEPSVGKDACRSNEEAFVNNKGIREEY